MAGKVLDIENLIKPEKVACEIANRWHEWNSFRAEWLEEKKELRNYLYATDTRTTSNNKLPWSNSTTVPKLTQIYDNLKANYSAALFPKADWLEWEPMDRESNTLRKRDVIKGYVTNKTRLSGFVKTAHKLLDDWLIFGNCYGTVEYVEDYTTMDDTGEIIAGYIGPRLVRISPVDIVFNPIASEFRDSPKIIRSITSIGEFKKQAQEENNQEALTVLDKMIGNRREVMAWTDSIKADGFIADGFSSITNYYGSNFVEVLTFYGDIYDEESGELKTNRVLKIVDRAYIISDEGMPSWLGHDNIFHSGWRNRPDNLYAMGPLDNLVGLQYRIDHLENLKADVWDQVAYPTLKIRGDVEDFEYGVDRKIYTGDEGDVMPLLPDMNALNAELQIDQLERRMEELAGAPRESLGIRTPGEKTKFEIQTLSQASGRVFQHKAEQLERELFEPVLLAFLEVGRRNMNKGDTIRMFDSTFGMELFQDITKEDITAKGRIRPRGASHFAESANRVQNLTQVIGIKTQDPSIGVHLSGKRIAESLAFELGDDRLYEEYVGIKEEQKMRENVEDSEAEADERRMIKAEQGL